MESQNMVHQAYVGFLLVSGILVHSAATHEGQIVPDWETINRESGVDKNLYEGDVKLSLEQKDFLSSRKGLNFSYFPLGKWPDVNGYPRVPYRFDPSLTNASISAINDAIAHWTAHTCIVFQKTTNASQSHLLFTKLSGCWSYIGRISTTSGQNVSIGTGCETLGIVTHEIGHALGFFHEQSRDDRDSFVVINFNNTDPASSNNFRKELPPRLNRYGVPYDFSSDMHYGSTYFSSNGKLTIVTKDPLNQVLIGQRSGLSHRDKRLANLMYGCTSKWLSKCAKTTDPCKNEGYLGASCTCVCPAGTNGTYCETLTATTYEDALRSKLCARQISSQGLISSPGYPTSYSNGVQCIYSIRAPAKCRVKLQFLAFSLYPPGTYCLYDILELRLNGTTEYGPVYCGTQIAVGTTFTSTNETAILYFSTRAFGNGWQANVTFVS